MRKRDVISVIVPVYNVEKYLERCVESIMKQTYDKLQIILVDDDSKDKSGAICDELAERDSRICVIHKNWGGLAETRNVGLAFACGEYISFVDSDDYIHETMLHKMIMSMKQNNCDIAVCGRVDIWENNLKIIPRKSFCLKREKIYKKDEILREYFLGGDIEQFACWDKMFHYSVIEGLRFPFGKTSEDVYFTYAAFRKSRKVVHVAKPLYFYYHRAGSITTKLPVDKTELDVMDFLKKIEKSIWKENDYLSIMAFYSFYVSAFNVVYEEIRKSAEVDKSFKKYKIKLKKTAFKRFIFIFGNPYILPEKRKRFYKLLSGIETWLDHIK